MVVEFYKIFKALLLTAVFASFMAVSQAWGQSQFVAAIITGDLERYRQAHETAIKGIRAAGFTDDEVKVYVQTPNPDPISWANSIRKAVGLGADLILTYGAPPTLAAKHEARGTPIVFGDVYDPFGLDIVKATPPPGGNITGISGKTPLETLVKIYREIHSGQRMGVLYTSFDQGSVLQIELLADQAKKYGFSLEQINIKRPEEISPALEKLAGKVDSLFVSESVVVHLGLDEIMEFADREKTPLVSQIPGLCDRGALITLEADPTEQGEAVSSYVINVLAGARPGTLPVRSPRRVSLLINLKVAKELNLKVPFQALSLATRVVQ